MIQTQTEKRNKAVMYAVTLNDLWAKTDPFQSIRTHSLLTGLTARLLLEEVLPQGVQKRLAAWLNLTLEELRDWIGYYASLHDAGKINYDFQRIWKAVHKDVFSADFKGRSKNDHFRHELATDTLLSKELWSSQPCPPWMIQFYSAVLSAHHQGKSGNGSSSDKPGWKTLRTAFEQEMRHTFLQENAAILPALDKKKKGPAGALLLGLVILADWIASGELFADAEDWLWKPRGRAEAEEKIRRFLDDSGLKCHPVSFGDAFSQVWPNIPAAGMRGLQQGVETLFQTTGERISLVLLEAPMGEGKTEAGVYAAAQMAKQWEKTGFYLGLPTAATSNQMVGRMRSFLELHASTDSVRLLHSMAWLVDEEMLEHRFRTEEARFAASWMLPARRGLLSPYAVGTVDQAMMSVLLVKYGVLRLLGLAGKVLVIDELHAYDAYMSTILQTLLAWCRALEIPVVLLSATLTMEKKREMLSVFTSQPLEQVYPAVTAVTESGTVLTRRVERTEKRYTLTVSTQPILHQSGQIAALAVEQAIRGGCICVLLNTVRQAQDVYRAIQQSGFDGVLRLFHARFPADQRDAIEIECIRLFGRDKTHRPQRAILVATQVVEQSLDVDFDTMITAVAPIDLLLQRAGRVCRHDDTLRPQWCSVPTLTVLVPEKTGDYREDEAIYPPCLLNQSIRLMEDNPSLSVPEDISRLVEQGYDAQFAPESELESWMKQWMEDQVKASASTNVLLSSPEKGFDPIERRERVQFDDLERSSYLSAKTRLGEPTARIVLLEQQEFEALATQAGKQDGKRVLTGLSVKTCRHLMKQSVSVREKLLTGVGHSVLYGRGRLEGVRVYLARTDSRGRLFLQREDGALLVLDPDLGLLFEKEGTE